MHRAGHLLAGLVWTLSACDAPASLEPGHRLVVLPPEVRVGDEVRVALARDGDEDAQLEDLLERVAVSPAGVLEPAGPGRFVAVGAGTATATLELTGRRVTAAVTVACPDRNTDLVVRHERDLTADETWTAAQGRHVVAGLLHVDGARLTVGACAELQLEAGAGLVVAESRPAQLVLRGTRENPLVIEAAPDGGGIRLHVAAAAGSELRWTTLRGAAGLPTSDGTLAVLDLVGEPAVAYDHAPIALEGVSVEDCGDLGLRLSGLSATSNVSWRDNRVQGCASYPVSVDARSLGAVPAGVLTGNGVDELEVRGGYTGENYQYWRNPGVPYHVQASVLVGPEPGALVSVPHDAFLGGLSAMVAPGARLRFAAGTGLFIGGAPEDDPATLVSVRFAAFGTLQEPVVFTSAAAEPHPGDSIGIVFTANATLLACPTCQTMQCISQLRHSVVEYAGGPTGLLDGDGLELRGGVVVLPELAGVAARMPVWLLEGSLARCNDGYGLVVAAATAPFTAEAVAGDVRRYFGSPSCMCDNAQGPLAVGGMTMEPTETPWTCDRCRRQEGWVQPEGECQP